MKKITKFGLLAFFAAAMTFVACTPEEEDVRLEPELATMSASEITSESALIIGYVIAEGDGFSEKGVCYDVTTEPTVENMNVVLPDSLADNAQYNLTITGLDYATKYYARAYAIGEAGAFYGDTVSFTTLPIIPELTTDAATAITGNSATTGGAVSNNGGAPVTVKGVVFGTETAPTIDGSKTEDGEGVDAFVSSLTELSGNTMYYVRAYATNSAGTGYGPEVTFTTSVDFAVVTTASASEIDKTTATVGGDLTGNGGGTVSEKGIVWGTTLDPVVGVDTKVADASTDLGAFTAALTGLDLATEYHVRAYAINEAGTAYGADVAFTTLADITKFWVVGAYNGWDNSDNAQYIESTDASAGEAEGYVYLTGNEFKLTTDHTWGDPGTFGWDGTNEGILTNGGNNISVAATGDGMYLIKGNRGAMTYSTTKTDWGLIGAATPGGWDTSTDLAYNADKVILFGGVHLTVDNYKFRANNGWDINLGAGAEAGDLAYGGGDIPCDTEADYAITLDLSSPNAYTYSANRWGVIGNATPGGWDNDTDMTWDAANSVFTATMDLVEGEFKFRANDDWGVNFGGALDALAQDGANIAVAAGDVGNYTLTLNPWTGIATMTKN